MILLTLFTALVLGVLVGTFSGLIPGLHVNLVASLMVGLYVGTSHSDLLPIAVFIACVAVSHSFFDFVPSLFLGVPPEALSLLPGHQLVREGKGAEALWLCVEGSWRALVLAITLASVSLLLGLLGFNPIAAIEHLMRPFLFWILLGIAGFLLFLEKRAVIALVLFMVAGLFGLIVLGSPLIADNSPFGVLFPTLSGLFGLPGLIAALLEPETSALPLQRETFRPAESLQPRQLMVASLTGGLGGTIVGLLPGLGAANAATLASLGKEREAFEAPRAFLVTTAAIQASDALFGIAALYFIHKTRSGASVAINALVPGLTLIQTAIILGCMFLAGYSSRRLVMRLWPMLLRFFNRASHRGLTLGTLAFIVTLVALSTGLAGMLILAASTLLGLLPPLLKVRKSQLMGFFLLPVLLFFSGHEAQVVDLLGLQAKQSFLTELPSTATISVFLFVSLLTGLTAYRYGSWVQRGLDAQQRR